MTNINKLLQSTTVEWKTLGEVATITIGEFVHQNNQDNSAEFPVYNGGISPTGYYDKFNNSGNKIIVSARGANAGFVNRISKPYWAGNSCYSVGIKNEDDFDWLFVYYYLKNGENKLISNQQKGSIPSVSKSQIEKLLIPIPPLKIQQEIVAILDKFTLLTAELTAELTARKKQYEYYREQLLMVNDKGLMNNGVKAEWKTLGEVVIKSYSGSTPLAGNSNFYENGTIPWLRTQEVKFTDIYFTEIFITDFALNQTSVKWIPSNCVIIAMSGATAGRSAINKIPLTTNQHCLCLEVNQEIANYRYVFHWVSFNFMNIKNIGQGARGDLNSSMIKNFKIPIPPLSEQERIVTILDKFDTLTNSISEGLPKEIELRKKQYEYYREKLLTFV